LLNSGNAIGTLHAERRNLLRLFARVIAVELHPARVRQLPGRFAGLPVTVVHADAASMRLPRRPFRVVASPLYAISSPLLRLLLTPSSHLIAADLVLQRAVVRRYASGPAGGPGRHPRQWRMSAGPLAAAPCLPATAPGRFRRPDRAPPRRRPRRESKLVVAKVYQDGSELSPSRRSAAARDTGNEGVVSGCQTETA
jgi:23S rRNA (adenine-N6)-dimethyltransferase